MDEHHKMQRFLQKNESKLSVSFPQKVFRINQFVNSVILKQLLEPKLVNSVRLSHSSVAPRLLGFHKVLNSVTPIVILGQTENYMCNGLSRIGGTEFHNSVGPKWFRRKPNPKFSIQL